MRKIVASAFQPQYRLRWALLLSAVLHFAIVVATDAGRKSAALPVARQVMLEVRLPAPAGTSARAAVAPALAARQSGLEPLPGLAETAAAESAATDAPLLKQAQGGAAVSEIEKKYYSLKELDVAPHPLDAIEPAYPAQVPDNIRGGLVRLQVLIDETGRVDGVTVLSSSPPVHFDDAAVAAFRRAHFSPGVRHGENVPSRLTLQVRFRTD